MGDNILVTRFWHGATDAELLLKAEQWAECEPLVGMLGTVRQHNLPAWADLEFVIDRANAGLDSRARNALAVENDPRGHCNAPTCGHTGCARRRVAVKHRARRARIEVARRDGVVLPAASI